MIAVEHATKRFGHRRVLDDLSISFNAGEFVGLFGKNGTGKSTLLRCISNVSRLNTGKILWNGNTLQKSGLQNKIGMVSHASFLYESLTARENLHFYGNLYGITNISARVEYLLQKVNLSEYGNDVVRGFSRGMQQRLSIARAIIHEPEILFLDEPFSGLDLKSAALLESILADSKTRGGLHIMVSHDFQYASRLCSRFIFLDHGKILMDTPVSDTSLQQIQEKLSH